MRFHLNLQPALARPTIIPSVARHRQRPECRSRVDLDSLEKQIGVTLSTPRVRLVVCLLFLPAVLRNENGGDIR
jgi:hypothetical protein